MVLILAYNPYSKGGRDSSSHRKRSDFDRTTCLEPFVGQARSLLNATPELTFAAASQPLRPVQYSTWSNNSTWLVMTRSPVSLPDRPERRRTIIARRRRPHRRTRRGGVGIAELRAPIAIPPSLQAICSMPALIMLLRPLFWLNLRLCHIQDPIAMTTSTLIDPRIEAMMRRVSIPPLSGDGIVRF